MRTKFVTILLVILAIILCSTWILTSKTKSENTLILVHIMFRHGDRTPISTEDKNLESSLFPYKLGELTLKGKRRMYRLGKALRERYSNFLGDSYFGEIVEAISSHRTRTIVSLQCVLAALFLPSPGWEIEDGLKWQPIRFYQLPQNEDKIISVHDTCKKRMYPNISLSEHFLATIRYVEEKLGKKYFNFIEYLQTENNFQVTKEMGFEIPEWAKSKRKEMEELYLEVFDRMIEKILPEVSGELLKKITMDTMQKINGDPKVAERKVFVYSAHDLNVLALLRTIGNGKNNITYGSYVALEIHKIDEIYGVKVLFANHNPADPEQIWIESCGNFCPLDKFINLTRKFYLGPWCQ